MRIDKFDYDFDTFFALIFYDLLLSVLVNYIINSKAKINEGFVCFLKSKQKIWNV